jgi:hypothetical protein
MPEDRTDDIVGRRLALYAYLESLLSGRRVLEIRAGRGGNDAGHSAAFLRSLGARVVSIEANTTRIDDRFEVVIVPEGEEIARRAGAVAALRKLLVDGGRVIVAAANADRAGAVGTSGSADGLGYYDLHGALSAHFPHVQMLGVTPFLGMGVVEFEGAVDGLRIDSRLVEQGSEPPAAYVAVAGTQVSPGLGYALVQLPFAPLEARLASGAGAPSSAVLREEVDELRGRLRRAAEDRATLDDEVGKLRRALAEADESVVALTRKTADEMSAMTERLAGLRGSADSEPRATGDAVAARDEAERLRVRLAEAEARASAAEQRLEEVGGNARQRHTELEDALERLRLADNELQRARRNATRFENEAKAAEANAQALAEREEAIAARDERIARLESEKQDLIWRVAELEDKLTATIARAVRTDAARAVVGQPDARAQADVGPAPISDHARDDARASVLVQFQKAATAHVDELTELKASVAEQSALVVELEDAVRTAEARAAASDADATTLRKTAKDLEEADRSRRSRLAELEGKLIRFEHERRSAPPPAPALADDERAGWARERADLRAEIEKLAAHARGRNGHAAEKLDAMAAGVSAAPPPDAAASRLENTLGNYRQRASRLRDELEGIRRRFDALSASEIAGFLEELGADLEELGK